MAKVRAELSSSVRTCFTELRGLRLSGVACVQAVR